MDIQLDRMDCAISGYVGKGDAEHSKRGFERVAYIIKIDSPNSAGETQKLVDVGTRRFRAFVTLERGARVDLTFIHNGENIYVGTYAG